MSDIQAKLATLSPEQRKLFELLLQKQAAQAASAPAEEPAPQAGAGDTAIPRRNAGGPAPLSFGQQRLWLLDQFQPGSAFYNMNLAMQLEGPLDTTALEASLNEILRRHSVLRTTFAGTPNGEPVQVVAPELKLTLAHTDIQHLPAEAREAEAQRLINAESQKPFDLARGPLVRGLLVRSDEHSHTLILVMHHIICDGWSTGVILRELVALYPAFLQGKASPLPELPIQYTDYATWQREWLQGDVLKRQLAFWRQQLDGKAAPLDLPTDVPRSPAGGFTARGVKVPVQIDKPLTDALSALSKQEGATLFMTLLAAFQTLLHRYSGQAHVLVGSPIANRNRDQIEGMIGFFNNMLVLHSEFADNPPFRELLRRTRTVTLQAYDHQELPFERLAEEFQQNQSMNRSPLFQVMFALQNTPRPVLRQGALTLRPLTVDNGTARFDLSFSLRENEQGLSGSLLYNADLFEAATIERLLGHYRTLLESAVATPDQPAALLPILGEAERQQLLEWSADAQIYLLDQHMQLVPIGVPGDLYIGDTGMSGVERGEPVPNPFSDAPEARLYKTGQRARFRADSTMDILATGGEAEGGQQQVREYVAPRTPIEEELVNIWVSVLGQERIGVQDDFFDLGGHSLSAARLLTRVRETFRVDLPLRRLFEATTIAQMAHLVVAHEARPGQTEKIARTLQRIRGASAEEKRLLLDQKRRERTQQ
ncbi:MAG: hypothetical protein OHK0022_57190 [Roseiflexaceae bacterium]